MRKPFLSGLLVVSLLTVPAFLAPAAAEENVTSPPVTVYKSPWCGCCEGWIDHMRAAGFTVEVNDFENLDPVKRAMGVPEQLESCHTASVGGYTIEGHVPASEVIRLLTEKPAARGLSVPGMVVGSPGMEQGNAYEPYAVVLFSDARRPIVYRQY